MQTNINIQFDGCLYVVEPSHLACVWVDAQLLKTVFLRLLRMMVKNSRCLTRRWWMVGLLPQVLQC